MKKAALLNADLTAIIASMGHTDTLTIGDCGLSISENVRRIDLALTHGVPDLLETLSVTLTELDVEQAILAEEIKDVSPEMHAQILKCLGNQISVSYLPHKAFKKATACSRAIVRTGECTSFSNIILVSGVSF